MAEEVSLSLTETNEIRRKLGLKPIQDEDSNVKQIQNTSSMSLEETNKLRIQAGLTPISMVNDVKVSGMNHTSSLFIEGDKIQRLRRRLNQVNEKLEAFTKAPLLTDKDDTSEDWLAGIGKEKHISKPVGKIKLKYEEEIDDAGDLPTLKLSHKMNELSSGKDIFLTLKEADINAASDDDVLEDLDLTQQNQTAKNIKLQQMNKERKRKKITLNVSSKNIEEQDNDYNEDPDAFIMVGGKTDIRKPEPPKISNQHDGKTKVNFTNSGTDTDDGGDYKPVKIKKRARKDKAVSQSKRTKPITFSKIAKVNLVDEDEEDDLTGNVIKIKSNNSENTRIESRSSDDIALEIQKERMEREIREKEVSKLRNVRSGLVLDENTSFLNSLNASDFEKNHINNNTEFSDNEDSLSINQIDFKTVDANSGKGQFENVTKSVESNVDFYGGLASMVNYMKDQNMTSEKMKSPTTDISNNELLVLKEKVEVRKIRESIDREAKIEEERYNKDELEKINQYKNRQILNKIRNIQDEKLRDYNPEVQLTYKDDEGNVLTTKEAYKKLSQKFHGTKSNAKKQQKFKNRVQARGRETQDRNEFDFGISH